METVNLDSSIASSLGQSSMDESLLVHSEGEEDAGRAATGGKEHIQKAVIVKKKRNKPKTKGLVKKLQEQIEFYFGDANLPRDKFLQQKMKENNGYVPVEVVASFKKMQSLTTDVALVLKAIRNSSLLELSKDSNSLRRSCPVPTTPQSDVDARTVYVENLHVRTTDHDTVSKMFKVFGDIRYISLPRYRTSGDIKGFAFVEFSTQETATKAVEYFRLKTSKESQRKPDEKLKEGVSTDTAVAVMEEGLSTEESQRPAACEVVVADGERGGTKAEGVSEEEGMASEGAVMSSSPSVKRGMKRVRESDDGGEGTEEGGRKIVRDSDDDRKGDRGTEEGGRKRVRESDEDTEEGEEKRVGKNGGEEDITDEGDITPAAIVSTPPTKRTKLEEMSHTEETAGEKMGVAKGTEVGGAEEEAGKEVSEAEETSGKEGTGGQGGKRKRRKQQKKKWAHSMEDLRVMTKAEWLSMKAVFKDLQKSHMKQVKSETAPPGAGHAHDKRFVKDCLVRVELEEEWVESRWDDFKEFCGRHGEVAFIDLKPGNTMGYVRFKMSGCVGAMVQSADGKPSDMTFSAVEEGDERAYYLKTQAERKQRFMKVKKGLKQRGQDKLVSRALQRTSYGSVTRHNISTAVSSSTSSSAANQPIHIKFSDSD